MRLVFRPWRALRRVRRLGFIYSIPRPSDLTPSGVSAAAFVGRAIYTSTFSSSGIAALAAVGRKITPATLTAAGVGSVSVNGTGVHPAALAASGTSVMSFEKIIDLVTSRRIIQDPVDCVLAGQQREFKAGRAPFRALRGIFRE